MKRRLNSYFRNNTSGKKDKNKRALIRIPKSAGTSLISFLEKSHINFIDLAHLNPTKKNIEKYKDYKKIILLRDPLEIPSSIKRGIKNKIHNEGDFDGMDFRSFYEGWLKSFDKNCLLITFYELTSNPKKSINRIERFWNLPLSKNVKLPKKRYSHSLILKLLRIIYIKLKKKKFLLKIKRRIIPHKGLIVSRES